MLAYVILFATSFLYIGLKAFQQLNVVHGQFWAVFPTSLFLALCEAFVMVNTYAMAKDGFPWYLVLSVGTGGGFGCIVSMLIHRKMTKNGNQHTV